MATFTVTIDDPKLLAAITAAREAYNAEVPEVDEIATDPEYIQFIVDRAARSWHRQHVSKDAKIALLEKENDQFRRKAGE